MKTQKKIFTLLTFLIFCCFSFNSVGQATSAPGTNAPSTTANYLGWTIGTQGSGSLTFDQLTIKNEDPMPINFYTNAGAGGYAGQCMTLFDGVGAANAGYAGIGIVSPPRHLTILTLGASLVGTTPNMTELLVAGGIRNDNTGRQTVADFQSANESNNSIGMRIRGARTVNKNSDCAYIDFDNYYDNDSPCEFKLAKISADVRKFGCDDAAGYFRIKTADGTVTDGYNLAVFADFNGRVGIGLNFAYTEPPNTRLEVWDVNTAIAQFRITQDYALDIFSDFTTHSNVHKNVLIN